MNACGVINLSCEMSTLRMSSDLGLVFFLFTSCFCLPVSYPAGMDGGSLGMFCFGLVFNSA